MISGKARTGHVVIDVFGRYMAEEDWKLQGSVNMLSKTPQGQCAMLGSFVEMVILRWLVSQTLPMQTMQHSMKHVLTSSKWVPSFSMYWARQGSTNTWLSTRDIEGPGAMDDPPMEQTISQR